MKAAIALLVLALVLCQQVHALKQAEDASLAEKLNVAETTATEQQSANTEETQELIEDAVDIKADDKEDEEQWGDGAAEEFVEDEGMDEEHQGEADDSEELIDNMSHSEVEDALHEEVDDAEVLIGEASEEQEFDQELASEEFSEEESDHIGDEDESEELVAHDSEMSEDDMAHDEDDSLMVYDEEHETDEKMVEEPELLDESAEEEGEELASDAPEELNAVDETSEEFEDEAMEHDSAPEDEEMLSDEAGEDNEFISESPEQLNEEEQSADAELEEGTGDAEQEEEADTEVENVELSEEDTLLEDDSEDKELTEEEMSKRDEDSKEVALDEKDVEEKDDVSEGAELIIAEEHDEMKDEEALALPGEDVMVERPSARCNRLQRTYYYIRAARNGTYSTGRCRRGYVGRTRGLCLNGRFIRIQLRCKRSPGCPYSKQRYYILPATKNGKTARGRCYNGYVGIITAQCVRNRFVKVKSSCRRVKRSCPKNIYFRSGGKHGRRYKGRCRKGYVGTVSATCAHGRWIRYSVKCKKIVRRRCPRTYAFARGGIHGRTYYGRCRRGYIGRVRALCFRGKWIRRVSSCRRISCPITRIFTRGGLHGQKYKGKCPRGYIGYYVGTCRKRSWVGVRSYCRRPARRCPRNKYFPRGGVHGRSYIAKCPSNFFGVIKATCVHGRWRYRSSSCKRCINGKTYTRRCPAGYTGVIRATCRRGSFVYRNTCKRISRCPRTSVFRSGGYHPRTYTVSCPRGYSGYRRAQCYYGRWRNYRSTCRRTRNCAKTYNFPRGGRHGVTSKGRCRTGRGYVTARCWNGRWTNFKSRCSRPTICPTYFHRYYVIRATRHGAYGIGSCRNGYRGTVRAYCSHGKFIRVVTRCKKTNARCAGRSLHNGGYLLPAAHGTTSAGYCPAGRYYRGRFHPRAVCNNGRWTNLRFPCQGRQKIC